MGNSVITSMYICNTGNTTIYFNIYAVPSGSVPGNDRLIYCRVPVTSTDTYVIDSEKLMLQNGDSLHANIVDPSSISAIGLSQTAWGISDRVNVVFWSSDRNEYIVGGDNGKIATSATGESWTYRSGLIDIGWPSGNPVNGVTRIALKKYVAVGNNGWIGVSNDGVTWSNQTALSSTSWGTTNVNAITNNGSVYLAVGNNAKVATSTDGITWTIQSGLASTGWSTSTVWSAIWTGTVFMIGGDSGKIATSPDGVTWTYYNSLAQNPAWGSSTRVTNIVYSGSVSIGYMASTADSNKIATSTDGITWTYDAGMAAIAQAATVGAGSVAFRSGYGFYVAAASSDIFYKDLTGTWTKISSLNSLPWNSFGIMDLIWNSVRSEFVAVGYSVRVATSPDSTVWTYRTTAQASSSNIPVIVATVSSIGI